MKTVECALTSEKLACLEERALGWVLSKEDHLLQRHLRRAAISRVHTTVTVGYELTSSLGKARIVVYAVPECSGDSERRAHGE